MARKRRMIVDRSTVRSSDEYYRGNNTSVIRRSIADSTMKSTKELRPIPTPRAVDPRVPPSQTSTQSADDRYYREQGSRPVRGKRSVDAPQLHSTAPIVINDRREIQEKIRLAIQRIQSGYVPVQLLAADDNVLRATRTSIELAVGRSELTAEQEGQIVFGRAMAVAPPPALPPIATPRTLGPPERFVAPPEPEVAVETPQAPAESLSASQETPEPPEAPAESLSAPAESLSASTESLETQAPKGKKSKKDRQRERQRQLDELGDDAG